MILAGAGVVTAAAGAYAYYRPKEKDSIEGEDGELVDPPDGSSPDGAASATKTWRESAGRETGPESYVFGDLTRGVVVRLWGSTAEKSEEDRAIEAAGDEQYSHVQKLVRDAVRIYRARGYTGTINMSYSVAHFTETCSVRVEGPIDDVPPWETSGNEVDAEALAAAMGEHGRSGRVFTTLLARLERRARNWEALSDLEGLNPSLTSAAQVGFALPVIKLGWGVSVSLTVTTSSLLRYAAYAVRVSCSSPQLASNSAGDAEIKQLATELTRSSVEGALQSSDGKQ